MPIRRISEVTDRRNDLLHAQYRPSAQDADGITGKVEELADKLGESLSDQDDSCFVNLTNHPSAQWEREQTETALALAERIEDVCFPNVPPEASEKDLSAIAEACVAQLPPGSTHALVQGEFTLAFEIVRRLQKRNITCVAATTERQVEDSGEGVRPAYSASCGFAAIRLLDAASEVRLSGAGRQLSARSVHRFPACA